MRDIDRVKIAKKIAWSFLGKPYLWGGDDPIAGFDCSGFVIEILKSVGMLPRSGDWTANTLYHDMGWPNARLPEAGMLAFWRKKKHQHGTVQYTIIHVEFCLNEYVAIGASGGGGRTMTMQDAIEQNAYIKVRPFRSRKNLVGFKDPFYVEAV